MAGATATTYYDVVTRYRLESGDAQRQLDRYGRSTRIVQRDTRMFNRELMLARRGLGTIARVAGPAIGGLLGVAGAYGAVAKTFQNYNRQQNAAIQLGSQINLAFESSTNAVENFNLAMRASDKLVSQLTRDAAKLPGELSDFIDMAKELSGPAFAAGAGPERLRGLTNRLALFTPGVPGADFRSSSMGAAMMLQGVARSTNPLFRAMLTQRLLGPGIGGAEDFNALSASERLERLDSGLAKIAKNELFRKRVLETFDTQLGTLADSIFGEQGLLGRRFWGSFDRLLDSLTRFNAWLDQSLPLIDKAIDVARGTSGGLNLTPAEERYLRGPALPGGTGVGGVVEQMHKDQAAFNREAEIMERAMERARNLYLREHIAAGHPLLSREDVVGKMARNLAMGGAVFEPRYQKILEESVSFVREFLAKRGKEEEDPKFTPRSLSQPKVEQHFNMKLDVRTDDSPEALAVKIEKTMAKVGQHPRTSRRPLSLLPGTSPNNP